MHVLLNVQSVRKSIRRQLKILSSNNYRFFISLEQMIFPGVVSKKQCCNTGSNGLLPEHVTGTKNIIPRNTHHKNLGVTHIFLGVISPNSRNLLGVTPRNTKLTPNFTLSRIYPRSKEIFPRFFFKLNILVPATCMAIVTKCSNL